VQLSRKKGWRMPENTVKVDRTNKTFGNIFTVGCIPSQFSTALPDTCETVGEAIECFRYYAESWMAITRGQWIERLRGKNLACWCRLCDAHKDGKPFGVECADCAACHSDVLGDLALAPTTHGGGKANG
jgi:hypothetical protein